MPNRVIRDWTTSEKMNELSAGAEVFFTRLIQKADDYGSFHANPKLLKAALFPLKDYTIKQIESWLCECTMIELIGTYEVEGKMFIRIVNFGQRLQNMRNSFPQPENGNIFFNSKKFTVIHGDSPPETKRNETEEETETKAEKPLRAFEGIFLFEDVQHAWIEWEQYRKEKKQKLTPSTAKKQMDFLGGRAGPEAIAIINQSITNGWTGLFELKTNGKQGITANKSAAHVNSLMEGFKRRHGGTTQNGQT